MCSPMCLLLLRNKEEEEPLAASLVSGPAQVSKPAHVSLPRVKAALEHLNPDIAHNPCMPWPHGGAKFLNTWIRQNLSSAPRLLLSFMWTPSYQPQLRGSSYVTEPQLPPRQNENNVALAYYDVMQIKRNNLGRTWGPRRTKNRDSHQVRVCKSTVLFISRAHFVLFNRQMLWQYIDGGGGDDGWGTTYEMKHVSPLIQQVCIRN